MNIKRLLQNFKNIKDSIPYYNYIAIWIDELYTLDEFI